MRFFAVVLLAAPLLLAAAPPPPPAPPAVGAHTSKVAGARVTDAVLPGRLVAVAFPRRADGRRRVIALVEGSEPSGSEATRDLFLVDPEGSGNLLRLVSGLPGEADVLASTDLDGDRLDEILLGSPGGTLWTLGTADAAREARPLLKGIDPRRILGLAAGEIAVPEVGRLRTWSRDGEKLVPGASFELPVRARRAGSALRLETPDVEALPQEGQPPLYLIGPEENGKTRLRTVLLTRDAEGAEQRSEAWSRFSAPESVDGHWFVRVDGRPMLIVTTTSAEKVSIFEKQKLRVFPLSTDRSRSGQPPVLSTPTASHRWFPARPVVLDLDRDGREDLVVAQQEGLRGKSLLVEAFFGRDQGQGRFELPSRKTSVDAQARLWSYGVDVTGDGRPDLVAVQEKKLVVFAGTTDPRRGLLDRRPRFTVDLSGAEQVVITASAGTGGADVESSQASSRHADPLQVIDLDGDGRPEIILTQREDGGRGRVTVVRLGG